VEVLHIVVGDGLAPKQDQVVLVDHVQANKPDAPVGDGVEYNPRVALDVKLLDAGPIATRLIPHRVDVAGSESAAVGATDRLVERRQCLLIHWGDFKELTLLKVLASQAATDDVNIIFELGDAKVNTVVHHLAECPERLCRNVEKENLRRGDIGRPVELICLIAANDENVWLIDDDNLALTDFLVEHFEAGPLQFFKIVVSVLIQLGEVKQLLADSSTIDTGAWLSVLIAVHVAKVLDLRLRHLELIIQMLHAVVTLLLGASNDAIEATLLAVEYDHRALLLV
jgi:hypothetical protein